MKLPIPTFKYGNEIAFGIGIAGLWIAGATAVFITPKAAEEIRQQPDLKHKILVGLKYYGGPILIAGLSTASLISVLVGKNKMISGLTLALTASEQIAEEYKDKVVEVVGDKKALEIEEKLADDKIKRTDIPREIKETIMVDNGSEVLCCELWNKKYFTSSRQKIDSAVNDANAQLNNEDYISLNDMYYHLGLEPVASGVELGWSREKDGLIRIEYTSHIKDNIPVLAFRYSTDPHSNFDRFA